jgi:hypothetical protein
MRKQSAVPGVVTEMACNKVVKTKISMVPFGEKCSLIITMFMFANV